VVAGKLQAQGLIDYSRGRVGIKDPAGLEKVACECYAVAHRELESIAGYAAERSGGTRGCRSLTMATDGQGRG
jgi:hypothetical protein